VWATAIFVAAVGVRLAAACGELAFDEVWSWKLAAGSPGVIEILTLRLDNNHILNTLVMYALGPFAEPMTYRLPAVASASAGLIFGCLLGRRRDAGIPVLILQGASHVLILYGSEARGYAYLTGCTLAAWWVLEEFLDRPRIWCRAGFALACALGFMSQLPFAFAYAGFVVYSVLRMYGRRHWAQALLMLHVWPAVAIIAVYYFYVEGLYKGGGDPFPLGRTVVAALSLMAGGPQLAPVAYIGAAVAALLLVFSIVAELRADRARGSLYLVAIVLAPAGVIAASGFEYVYPRHFLVPMIFGYVAVGCQMARWWQRGRVVRVGVAALLAGFVVCNALPVTRLITQGRSQDAAAFSWIAEHSDEPVTTISGDHDFRVALPLTYYLFRNEAILTSRGKELKYFERTGLPPSGTDWMLLHSSSEWDKPPPDMIVDQQRRPYKLAKVFPASSLCAFTWWIYRRQ
jgi:hypothetical protein